MAERRMFAKSIVDSDIFLDMPLSTQCLYFHLGMRADDDGFLNNPKKILRMIGCSEDELKMLIAKGFIIPFPSGVVVLTHWKMHNYIRSDRYKPTIYVAEKALLQIVSGGTYQLVDNADTNGIPDDNQTVYQMDTQVRLGKDRLEIGKDNSISPPASDEPEKENAPKGATPHPRVDYQSIIDDYNSTCTKLPACKKLTDARRKAIRARLNTYTPEELHQVFVNAQNSPWHTGQNKNNWTATFDWLMKDTNAAKMLERGDQAKPTSTVWEDEWLEEYQAMYKKMQSDAGGGT